MQERGPELVLARLVVLLDEADRRKRLQDAVHCPLRQPELTGELGDPETAVATRQEAQDRRSSLDRLDSCGQEAEQRLTSSDGEG